MRRPHIEKRHWRCGACFRTTVPPVSSAVLAVTLIVAAGSALGHGSVRPAEPRERTIEFPDTAAYETVVLDLHTHSVFSDGHVWPTVRVAEALYDGIDGLAITEHLEWQPHLTDIPHPDRNRAAEEAARAASGHSLLVIPGVEITRRDDVGHINAVFVEDANALVDRLPTLDHAPEHLFDSRAAAEAFAVASSPTYRGAHTIERDGREWWVPFADEPTYFTLINYVAGESRDAREVLQAARRQGAFSFWNHPGFASPNAPLPEFHREAVLADLLHGVEIANGATYYENAFRLALEHDLALIGTSDIHELIDWAFEPHRGGHRPVTLAFAASKSAADIQAALEAKRTVVWWRNTLLGRDRDMRPLVTASIVLESVNAWANGNGLNLVIDNRSDVEWLLAPSGDAKFVRQAGIVRLAPNEKTNLSVWLDTDGRTSVDLPFTVTNALVAPKMPLEWALAIDLD